mgnify:CR=1 FL=1
MEDYDFYVSEGISECFGLLIWVDHARGDTKM